MHDAQPRDSRWPTASGYGITADEPRPVIVDMRTHHERRRCERRRRDRLRPGRPWILLDRQGPVPRARGRHPADLRRRH